MKVSGNAQWAAATSIERKYTLQGASLVQREVGLRSKLGGIVLPQNCRYIKNERTNNNEQIFSKNKKA